MPQLMCRTSLQSFKKYQIFGVTVAQKLRERFPLLLDSTPTPNTHPPIIFYHSHLHWEPQLRRRKTIFLLKQETPKTVNVKPEIKQLKTELQSNICISKYS